MAQALVGALGWREAYATLGALTLAVTLPAALAATRGTRAVGADKLPVLPFIRTRAFILMCAIFLLLGMLSIGVLASLVPIMVGRGFTPQGAAQVAAVTGLAAIAGRGGIGWVLDRFHAPYVVCAIALIASAAFLLIAYGSGLASAYLIAACWAQKLTSPPSSCAATSAGRRSAGCSGCSSSAPARGRF